MEFMPESTLADKLDIVGKVLDHALIGAEILLREAGDWDGEDSYGGQLYQTLGHLKRAQQTFGAAKARRGHQ